MKVLLKIIWLGIDTIPVSAPEMSIVFSYPIGLMNRLRAVFCFLGRARRFACEWLVATIGEEVFMNPFKSRSEKVKSPFAEFIRNAKADEK